MLFWMEGHISIVQLLLRNGVDINTPPMRYKGFTALQGVAFGGHGDILKLLLDAGANVNARGSYYNGYTALSAAAKGGHRQIVEALLQAGADVSIASGNTLWTPSRIAIFRGHTDIAQLLKKREVWGCQAVD
ncbi:ankyrin repeat domain-containing protein [Aspergillus clavatus NRRL 1]|uniref:Ankyrin repeat protein n=1 Tax=Aspergillus clavatus (strain ATCC 1007 / CBS 513.65 / DSM 816 / NCTC 3887 / NRRL 1 / QM 1276 / 107) TaxID=344612 RepID=A1CFX5_ASPCL|nr:Ankyrin repeat protein [Aspergillus clavatus NRRL 1]EAW11774.1 Ankyrin repeat protein [Aspergillus clavatus NRRL 1]